MTSLKTQPSNHSAEDFIASLTNEQKREDCHILLKLMEKITGEPPVMWGESIIGFGNYHFKYKSGRELDWMLAGFSPRKQNLTIYIIGGFENQSKNLERIGKAKNSVGCLYVKKLADIDLEVLEEMIIRSVETVMKRYAKYN